MRFPFSFVRKTAAACLCFGVLTFPASGQAEMDQLIDGVPLPADVSPMSPADSVSPFAGTWIGTWDGSLKTILIVEKLTDSGKAEVVYAVADSPQARFKRAWFRYEAEIVGNLLTMFGERLTVKFELSPTGRLKAVLGDGYGFGVLTRQSFDSISEPQATPRWSSGTSMLLETDLIEDGKPVHLETLIYKPSGDGPFPLAVVNHGSTGAGDGSVPFTETWEHAWFAEILNERGWIVAFPQRRGRGKSDGLYDEGFGADRSEGYTCETERSLAGADRALEDLRAAIDALQRRPDVSAAPILLAGNSRGGALSVAYAGLHPEQVGGVINFVGGWMGDACETADKINQTLFARGAGFAKPTLWIYGEDDVFPSMSHSRKNFAAFQNAGGRGAFVEVTVAGRNNGHWAMAIPPLWSERLSTYLDEIK